MTRSTTDAADGRVTFTPGPWAISEFESTDPTLGSYVAIVADSRGVAAVYSNEGDARLIAAAPELYAALRWVYESGGDSTDAMYAAGELLARIDATDKPA